MNKYLNYYNGDIVQPVESLSCKQKVLSSILNVSIYFYNVLVGHGASFNDNQIQIE